MLARYSLLLERHPLLTKSVTASVVLGAGDAGTQTLVERRARVDWARSARFAGMGVALVGPSLHAWYGFLARRVPGASALDVAKRVAADQFVFAPVFLSGFVAATAAVEGMDPAYVLRRDLRTTLTTNWMVWIPWQTFVFAAVPLKFQVLANNLCGVAWNGFLSYNLHRADARVPVEPASASASASASTKGGA